jgi:DNA-binding LytR/AlgR family response regulator
MSFHKLQALVVEDEPAVRQELIHALNETLEFEVAGTADSVEDAFELVSNTPAEVLFLDIKLIGGDAFQLLNLLKRRNVGVPPVVINTGYREFEYAQKILNEFKDEAICILRKPFYEEWEKHQERIIEAIYLRKQEERRSRLGSVATKLVSIQDGKQTYLVNPDDLVLVRTGAKGQGKTEAVFQKHTIQCNLSLAQLLAKLPVEFVQINRYVAINIRWVTFFYQQSGEVHLRSGESYIIGSAFLKSFCEWMK